MRLFQFHCWLLLTNWDRATTLCISGSKPGHFGPGVKSLSEPMLAYYHLDHKEHISMKSYLTIKVFHSRMMQYVDTFYRPQYVDGPCIALVYCLPKPSPGPVVLYECDIKQSMFVNKTWTAKLLMPIATHCWFWYVQHHHLYHTHTRSGWHLRVRSAMILAEVSQHAFSLCQLHICSICSHCFVM